MFGPIPSFLSSAPPAMNRRSFVATSCLAGLSPLAGSALASGSHADGPSFLELRHYQPHVGSRRQRLMQYFEEAALPAWNRHGIGPVGVFTVQYGPNTPSVYVLLPHPDLGSVASLEDRLAEDEAYQEAGADFLGASLADPAFVRMESSLMRAFSDMPQVERPAAAAEGRPRVFELRIYESHSVPAARRKVEMFNRGNEIAIFRRTGLTPVFFGETIIGPQMPNLTYMLVFDDLAARDSAWQAFSRDPEWATLRQDPYYADTVSNIADYILQPTGFSQI